MQESAGVVLLAVAYQHPPRKGRTMKNKAGPSIGSAIGNHSPPADSHVPGHVGAETIGSTVRQDGAAPASIAHPGAARNERSEWRAERMATDGRHRRTAAVAFVGETRPSGPHDRIPCNFTHRFGGRAKFFDRAQHDVLIWRVSRKVRDRLLLQLIGRYLRSGVIVDGEFQPRRRGNGRGGPMSLLLANILLGDLDKGVERRGISHVR